MTTHNPVTPLFSQPTYYHGEPREAVLAALAEAPRSSEELVQVLLQPITHTRLSYLMGQLADANLVFHLEDSRWALWDSPVACHGRVREALRQPGVELPTPLTTNTLCRVTGLDRQQVRRSLGVLVQRGLVQRDSSPADTSWWLRAGRVEVEEQRHYMMLRVYGRVGQLCAEAQFDRGRNTYYVDNLPHLTLESAALAVLQRAQRRRLSLEDAANEDSPSEYPA